MNPVGSFVSSVGIKIQVIVICNVTVLTVFQFTTLQVVTPADSRRPRWSIT